MTGKAAGSEGNLFIGSDGVWAEAVNRTPGPVRRPALFLDRDGVIVEEVPYLHAIENARMVPGAVASIRAANRRALPVIVVTNQGGIGLEKYGWDAFARLQDWIWTRLADEDAFVNGLFACPHHPEGKGVLRAADHPDRKPNPGMILRAAEMFPIDLAKSWMVGDREIDMQAARRAGLAGGVLVRSEHKASGQLNQMEPPAKGDRFQLIQCDDRDHLPGALSPLWSSG